MERQEPKTLEQKLKEQLTHNEDIRFVDGGNPPTIPQAIGYEKFGRVSDVLIKEFDFAAHLARKLLMGTYMIDQFGADHPARRKWREQMFKKYGQDFMDLWNKNKLRINTFGGFISGLNNLILILDKEAVNTPQADTIRALEHKLPGSFERYNYLSVEEKIKVVQQVESVAQEFLNIVGK